MLQPTVLPRHTAGAQSRSCITVTTKIPAAFGQLINPTERGGMNVKPWAPRDQKQAQLLAGPPGHNLCIFSHILQSIMKLLMNDSNA